MAPLPWAPVVWLGNGCRYYVRDVVVIYVRVVEDTILEMVIRNGVQEQQHMNHRESLHPTEGLEIHQKYRGPSNPSPKINLTG